MKRIIGLLITVGFLFLIFHKLDFQQFLFAFQSLNQKYLLAVVPVYCLTFFLRTYRWRIMLPDIKCCKISSLFDYMFIGNLFNAIFPARAGDFYRSYLIGKDCCIKKVKAFASIFLERIFDGSVVLIFLIYSIATFYKEPWIYKLAIFVSLFFWGGFAFLLFLAKTGHPEELFEKLEKLSQKIPAFLQKPLIIINSKLNRHLKSFIDGLSVFHSFYDIARAFVLTALIWFIEGLVIYIVIRSYGLNPGISAAFFAMTLSVFGAMIPVTSASFGPYQYAFILGLGFFGMAKEQALAISITTQLVIFVLVAIGGAVALYKKHLSITHIKETLQK